MSVSHLLLEKENMPPLPPNARLHMQPLRRTMKRSPAKQRSQSTKEEGATDYSWEITYNMLLTESAHLPSPKYLQAQSEINDKTRAVLVDWLVGIHAKFNLLIETLFLSVSLVDRLLAQEKLPKSKLQLLGISALLVASKYEEVTYPPAQTYVDATEGAYTKKGLLDMERKILTTLNFHITTPTTYTFYTRATSLVVEDRHILHLAQYIMQLALPEYSLLHYKPSMVMCAAFFLAKRLRRKNSSWPDSLQKQFNYQDSDLKPCAKELYVVWQGAEKCVLQNIRKAYSTAQYGEIAKMKLSTC